MAATALTVKETSGIYPALPLTANSADFTFAVVDITDGGTYVADGTELILVQNTDAGTATVTIESVADGHRRTGSITAYSMGTGEFACFHVAGDGWVNSTDGKVTIKVSDVDVKIAVIRPKK